MAEDPREPAAHEEVALLRRQLADLEQMCDSGFWEFHVSTGIADWSDGLRRLYGVGPDVIVGYERWMAMVHPADREMVGGTIAAALERGGDYAFEHRFHRADDGGLRWTRCRGRVLPGPDGRPATIFGVSIDTTDEHRAAEQQAAFIANAAHELRTPAAAIGHAVQVLDSLPEDRLVERAEVTGVLRRQAGRLRNLATSLLDLTTIEAGPSAALLEPVGLQEAVKRAVAAVGPDDVEIAVGDDLVARADRDQLDQVLVNLLINARRYGGPNLSITGRQAGDRVELDVHDDGDGVPLDDLDDLGDLFAPFRRGAQRHPEASGLGLAIVDRVMHRLGGSVTYRGGPGEGATFTLDFESA